MQLFNRGLVTRAVGDDEDIESHRNQRELDVETDRAAAATTATVEPEIQRGASLPGVRRSLFSLQVATRFEKSGNLKVLEKVRENVSVVW